MEGGRPGDRAILAAENDPFAGTEVELCGSRHRHGWPVKTPGADAPFGFRAESGLARLPTMAGPELTVLDVLAGPPPGSKSPPTIA